MFIVKRIVSVLTMAMGGAIAFLACSVPAYFTSVDRHVVAAAGVGTKSLEDIAMFSLDETQVSTAKIIADVSVSAEKITNAVEKALKENPSWRIAGGDEPFFDIFCSSVEIPKQDFIPVYKTLAARENRKKLFNFLAQSKNAGVKKILVQKDLNSVMLPPSYSAAGAPFEASLLTLALLVQSGNLNEKFMFDIYSTISNIKNNAQAQESFERCLLGVLALSQKLDCSALGALFKTFKSPSEVCEFARIYASQKNEHFRNCLYVSAIVSGDVSLCVAYLKNADTHKWGSVSFALERGEGALMLLLNNGKPIYQNSKSAQYIDAYCSPMKHMIAPYCVQNLQIALTAKILLLILGGSFVAGGVLRFFRMRRSSGLFSIRCLLFGVIGSVFVFWAFEPEAFNVKIENNSATELKIVFDKVKSNIVGDKDMFSLDTDSATLAAIALFFVMQLTVYIICLVRLSIIKRTRASASLKLKLLENEDNLFDLGLYIGLAGTVASLILLTFGIITASLMAGYTSTLFGILFTALVKVGHVRKLKRKLLIESSNEQ